MLGLKTPKTRSDCDPGLEAEMRLLGCLDEEEEQQPWEDLPTNADEQEALFSLGVGAQGAKPEDKLQALLQEKVEKEKEKEKEKPPKREGSRKEIQWHEGLEQREPTLAEVTAGKNVVNPQAQPFGAEDEENGEDMASPSMRVRTTDQNMVDTLLESPQKRKEEAPAPLVQDGGRKEAKKSKKSGDSKKERKKARRAEQAKRAEAASKETERRSKQESSPAVVGAHAPKELARPETGRAMEINGLEKKRASGQREGQKPAETQLRKMLNKHVVISRRIVYVDFKASKNAIRLRSLVTLLQLVQLVSIHSCISLPHLLIQSIHLNIVDPKISSKCIETTLQILEDVTIFHWLQMKQIAHKQHMVATHKFVATRVST
jgi:hypothetical protein